MSGTWNFNFGFRQGHNRGYLIFDLIIQKGDLSINGKPVTLMASTNFNYPTSRRWVKFNYQGKVVICFCSALISCDKVLGALTSVSILRHYLGVLGGGS